MNDVTEGLLWGAGSLLVLRMFFPKGESIVFGSVPMDLGFVAGGFIAAAMLRGRG